MRWVHKKYLRLMILLGGILLLLLLSGCSYPQKVLRTFSHKAVLPHAYQFADGGAAQYFYLKKSLKSSAPVASPDTYIFVVGGSDCTSFSYFLPEYFRGLEGESGDIHIYMLQKRFIGPRTWGRSIGCSDEFVRADFPEQWIADQLEFIRYQLSLLNPNPKRRIMFLGISEGGEIVPILAQHIPQLTHMVILANGGLDPWDAYVLQKSKKALLPDENLHKMLVGSSSGIDESRRLILGRTVKYWAQVKNIRQIDNLLLSRVPVLMAMGTEDQVVPVESALYAKEQFEKLGNTRLTMLTYSGADHSLMGKKINFLPDFFHKMDLWLGENSSIIFESAP